MEPRGRILIVDYDVEQRRDLAQVLEGRGYRTETAEDGVEGLQKAEFFSPDIILTDLNMPRMSGFEFIGELQRRRQDSSVIVLTAYGGAERAVEAVHDLKAFWLLEKPVSTDVLLALVERGICQLLLRRETRRLVRELSQHGVLGALVGKSQPIQEVFSLIRQVAPSLAAVLVTGESGTGKELVAREIHRLSPRAGGPFVAVNCAALSENLIESELFGHEKGSFTGAVERRIGCFEEANGGTLFLDEFAEMPLQTQSKLLRVLEEMVVRRLGGKHEIKVDARIIASTNASPEVAVQSRKLREDLYYRLAVFRIDLPPLRERRADIGLIAEAMIQRFNQRHGTQVTGIDSTAMNRLEQHSWPGNVRELRNVIERAVISTKSGSIRHEHITLESPRLEIPPNTVKQDDSLTVPPGLRMASVEEAYILTTLRYVKNDRKKAAAVLGISLRTLQTRLGDIRRRNAAMSESAGSKQ